MNKKPVIGLTMGDPAGVGPELCLRTLANPDILERCHPILFGHLDVLEQIGRSLSLPLPANLKVTNGSMPEAHEGPAVINCPQARADEITPGRVDKTYGAAAFEFIRMSIDAALAGTVDAVVTAPVHKEALRLAGVKQPGHTEIFTELTGARRSCMMLWSEALTVSMATTHIGYGEVPGRLSVERLLDVIELTAEALGQMNARAPRLAVCGLNPHAGEHGLFGQREEERFVEPAVAKARELGISIEGPLPPDTAFTEAARKRFDGFICLYHDQGHIPFKMLAFDDGVNVTLGLPIVRTSVDHGTAFDIAWKGIARPTSLYRAVECALRLSAAREQQDQPA
jgi:4-hydroxythreonine-4-phosphate dehydrogenase